MFIHIDRRNKFWKNGKKTVIIDKITSPSVRFASKNHTLPAVDHSPEQRRLITLGIQTLVPVTHLARIIEVFFPKLA